MRNKKKNITKAIGLLNKELEKARLRQHYDAKRPSGCMRGLQIAIGILEEMRNK